MNIKSNIDISRGPSASGISHTRKEDMNAENEMIGGDKEWLEEKNKKQSCCRWYMQLNHSQRFQFDSDNTKSE